MKKISCILIFGLLTLFCGTSVKNVNASATQSAIVVERDSGRILYEENINERKPIASLTKVMTALVVIENISIDKLVTIKKECCGIEGSSIYLREGEKLTVKDLLYGLMLRSGNDCAEQLAIETSGSIENFAKLMNEKAKELEMNDSSFVNPHGLDAEGHYSSARDLAVLSANAMKNEVFREIVATESVKIPNTIDGTNRLLVNKNKMLYNYEDANGIKTGFTKKSGRCFIGSAEKNGMQLICVVLNCPPMFEYSERLLRETFNSYTNEKIIDSNIFNQTNGLSYIKEDFVYPLNEIEKTLLKITCEPIEKNEKTGEFEEKIGKMSVWLENELIFSQNIYTIIGEKKERKIDEIISEWNLFCNGQNENK